VVVSGAEGKPPVEGAGGENAGLSGSAKVRMNEMQQTKGGGLLDTRTFDRLMIVVALAVFALDQFTKFLVNHYLDLYDEKIVIPGFFKFVHWGNTGAAWSLFTNRNGLLIIVGVVALLVLFRSRRHFFTHPVMGPLALGLIFGGILGNLTDRVVLKQVTDFLYFYLERRGAGPIGFPAFNVADSAICIGVGLIFISSLKKDLPLASPPAG
jgi:signal peptidase II